MDGKRFDSLTRAFGNQLTRRRSLRVALGVAVAGGLRQAQAAKATDCPAGTDPRNCSPLGGFCHNSSDCCGDLRCIYKECAECLHKDAQCKDDMDCCSNSCKHGACTKKKGCKKC